MFTVEIDTGVWISKFACDRGFTGNKDHAKQYKTMQGAKVALGIMVRRYQFTGKQIISVIRPA